MHLSKLFSASAKGYVNKLQKMVCLLIS